MTTPDNLRRFTVLALTIVGLAAASAIGCGGGSRPWVVLVVVDALRADHLGLYGYGRPTSPFIDEWAVDGAVFERAYSTAPWTLPAFGTLYTGALPWTHGAGIRAGVDEEGTVTLRAGRGRTFARLRGSVPTLAEQLSDVGVCTAAFVNNIFLDPRFGMARGFDVYDYVPGSDTEIRRADATVDAALDWLDGPGTAEAEVDGAGDCSSRFLMVHLFDPHRHYDAPEPFRGRFTDEIGRDYGSGIESRVRAGRAGDGDFLMAAYDEEIAFVDREIGRLVRSVEERAPEAGIFWVLTSDHGELFGVGRPEEEGRRAGHGHSLAEGVLRVPLVFVGPGVAPGRHAAAVSLTDVAPTIREAVGIEGDGGANGAETSDVSSDSREFWGRSLWPAVGREAAVDGRLLFAGAMLYGSERAAVFDWPYQLTVEAGTGRRRLVDLSVEPGRRHNLAAADSGELASVLAELQQRLRRVTEGGARGDAVDLDPEMLEQLEALGYVR